MDRWWSRPFAPIPVRYAPFFDRELVGLEMLRELGQALYAETDPTDPVLSRPAVLPSRARTANSCSAWSCRLRSKDEIALSRHADEILIDVGSWRRNLVLPRALIDAPTLGAKFDDHVLKIRFAAPPRNSNGGGSRG